MDIFTLLEENTTHQERKLFYTFQLHNQILNQLLFDLRKYLPDYVEIKKDQTRFIPQEFFIITSIDLRIPDEFLMILYFSWSLHYWSFDCSLLKPGPKELVNSHKIKAFQTRSLMEGYMKEHLRHVPAQLAKFFAENYKING